MLQRYPLATAVWEHNRGRIVAVVILLLLVISIFVCQQLVSEPKLLALRAEQTKLQQNVRQRQMESANSGVPVSISEQIAKNIQQFNRLIPAQTDFSVFIGELFDWAQQAGLNIHQVSYQPEYDKGQETVLLRYGMNFSVKGDYSQVKKFIHLLENSQRIMLIEKISMSGTSAVKGDKNKVDLKIELATYFQGGAV